MEHDIPSTEVPNGTSFEFPKLTSHELSFSNVVGLAFAIFHAARQGLY